MEITCDIAMDLVDIYSSGMASRDTERTVKEHLKTCGSCRKFYDEYKKILLEEKKEEISDDRNRVLKTETSPYVSDEIISESMKKLSKKLRTRRIVSNIVAIFSVIVSFAVLVKDITDIVEEKEN